MKRVDGFATDLITSIDVLNTLQGGVSEPRLKLTQFPDHRQIELKVPGVPKERFKAEIHNNHLTVFYTINVTTQDQQIDIPRLVYNKTIPYYIDSRRISAAFEGETFVVTLPYNELANGHHRDVTKVS